MTVRWVIPGIVALALAGCVSPEPENGLGIRVMTLTESGPQQGLPGEADTLRFVVMQGDNVLRDFSRSTVGLTDLDGDGPADREAIVEIPPDTEVSITVFASKAITLLATARVDGLVVPNGGRRFVNLTFTPIREVSLLPSTLPTGRFGHAAARIPNDGRVLVTGGFTASSPTTCPPALAAAEVCFRLEGSSEAFLIDASDGRVYQTLRPMLRPRALHTASTLDDGRILIAGGLDAAILGLVRIPGVLGQSELQPRIVHASEGYENSARTFEIFDPTLLAEIDDVGRDGDPEAGAFVGLPGDPGNPGQMNTARYLHAATPLPGDQNGILIVGGQGAGEATITGEVFLSRRTGGSGFLYPPVVMSDASNPRVWPAVATVDNFVYVVGGTYDPSGPSQLIDRWVPGAEPGSGVFQDLSTCAGWSPSDRPHNALVGAQAVVLGRNPQRVLVVGWMGPLCEEPTEGGEALRESYAGTVACSEGNYAARSFTVGVDECTFGRLQDPAAAHFGGAVAALPLGQAIIAGGFLDGQLHATRTVELLTGDFVGDTNFATRNTDVDLNLERGRAWFSGTPLNGGRVLFVGGMSFTYGADLAPTGIDFSSALEIYDPGYDPTDSTAGM